MRVRRERVTAGHECGETRRVDRTGESGYWLVVAGAGAVFLLASIAAARGPTIPAWERRVFQAVNGWPDRLYLVLWLPMQLGNLVVGTVVGVAIALRYGDGTVAICVVAAAVLKLVTERGIRHEMSRYLTVRQRPGTSMPGAIVRGDVPATGPSFPSGHVLLVAAGSCVVSTVLPPAFVAVAFSMIACVLVGRVYVAAHNPLDVTAGLGAGLLVGGVLATVLTW